MSDYENDVDGGHNAFGYSEEPKFDGFTENTPKATVFGDWDRETGFKVVEGDYRAMTALYDIFAEALTPPDEDSAPEIERRLQSVFSSWNKLYGNKIMYNATEDYAVIFKTYRGICAIGGDGSVKSCEVTRYENYDLFLEDENERVLTLAEIKWNNLGLLMTDSGRDIHLHSTFVGSYFDKNGSVLKDRASDAQKVFVGMLNAAMQGYKESCSFFTEIENPQADPDATLMRLKPEYSKKFRDAFVRDVHDYNRMRSLFLSHCNRESLEILDSAGVASIRGYNWVQGYDVTSDIRGDISRARHDALARFPLFYRSLTDLTIKSIQDNLNDGLDVLVPLAHHIGVLPETLERFEGITPRDIGVIGEAPINNARSFVQGTTLPDSFNHMNREERRSFVRSSFLISSLEQKLSSKNAFSMRVANTTELPSESEMMKAIGNVQAVSGYLTALFQTPGAALVSKNQPLGRSFPSVMDVLTYGRDVKTVVNVINTIADRMAADLKALRIKHPPKAIAGLDYKWGSMFRSPKLRLPDGHQVGILMDGPSLTRSISDMELFMPNALGICYETIRQYMEIQSADGRKIAMAIIIPDEIGKGGLSQNFDDDIQGVHSYHLASGCHHFKNEVIEVLRGLKSYVLNNPDNIGIAYLRGEQEAREQTLADKVRKNNAERRAQVCNVIGITEEAFRDSFISIAEELPDGLEINFRNGNAADFSSACAEYLANMREDMKDEMSLRLHSSASKEMATEAQCENTGMTQASSPDKPSLTW